MFCLSTKPQKVGLFGSVVKPDAHVQLSCRSDALKVQYVGLSVMKNLLKFLS
jgi:hypothetical protein